MRIYALNGTGTNETSVNCPPPVNATNDTLLQGTNDTLLQGTNSTILQGTNDTVIQGWYNPVIPINGYNGEQLFVSPLALLDYDDVPINGVPDDWSEDEIEAYRFAYMYGDRDAVNGLFKKLRNKIKRAREGNKDARNNRRARREARRELRAKRAAEGTRFIDKFGGAIKDIAGGLANRNAQAVALESDGIEYDPEILDQRTAIITDGGAGSGTPQNEGVYEWFLRLSPMEKAGLGLGVGVLAWLGYKALAGSNKKGKK